MYKSNASRALVRNKFIITSLLQMIENDLYLLYERCCRLVCRLYDLYIINWRNHRRNYIIIIKPLQHVTRQAYTVNYDLLSCPRGPFQSTNVFCDVRIPFTLKRQSVKKGKEKIFQIRNFKWLYG